MDEWDEAEFKVELRFEKPVLEELLNALRFPDKFVCSQRTVCSGMEGLCILLKRLAFPCRYTLYGATIWKKSNGTLFDI